MAFSKQILICTEAPDTGLMKYCQNLHLWWFGGVNLPAHNEMLMGNSVPSRSTIKIHKSHLGISLSLPSFLSLWKTFWSLFIKLTKLSNLNKRSLISCEKIYQNMQGFIIKGYLYSWTHYELQAAVSTAFITDRSSIEWLTISTVLTLKCWLLWGFMRKQETKQSIIRSTSAFWLPLEKGLLGLNSKFYIIQKNKNINQTPWLLLATFNTKLSTENHWYSIRKKFKVHLIVSNFFTANRKQTFLP